MEGRGREGDAIGRNMELTIIIFLSGFSGRNVPLMFPDDLSVSPACVCVFFSLSFVFFLFLSLPRGRQGGFLGGRRERERERVGERCLIQSRLDLSCSPLAPTPRTTEHRTLPHAPLPNEVPRRPRRPRPSLSGAVLSPANTFVCTYGSGQDGETSKQSEQTSLADLALVFDASEVKSTLSSRRHDSELVLYARV